MKTQIKKNGNTTVVNFEGKLDFETHLPLRQSLAKLISGDSASDSAPPSPTGAKPKKKPRAQNQKEMPATREAAGTDSTPKKIIFNLERLEFVGSSGIASFVQTLRDFNANAPSKPVYCNVKSEFKRVIRAFDETGNFEFIDSLEAANSISEEQASHEMTSAEQGSTAPHSPTKRQGSH